MIWGYMPKWLLRWVSRLLDTLPLALFAYTVRRRGWRLVPVAYAERAWPKETAQGWWLRIDESNPTCFAYTERGLDL